MALPIDKKVFKDTRRAGEYWGFLEPPVPTADYEVRVDIGHPVSEGRPVPGKNEGDL